MQIEEFTIADWEREKLVAQLACYFDLLWIPMSYGEAYWEAKLACQHNPGGDKDWTKGRC